MENLAKNCLRSNVSGKHGAIIKDQTIKNHIDHKKNIEELETSSIHGNRLEIASYGLSVPKTVSKREKNVKEMKSNLNKSNAQEVEQKKLVQPLESVIDSKIVVKEKKEVKSMDNVKKETKKQIVKRKVVKKRVAKKKAVQSKQRKGKSLLTAFRINRMEPRLTLNLNRGELRGKYA